ncbi:MAG: polysaccharide deacetylase family protein [Bacillota bacterium]
MLVVRRVVTQEKLVALTFDDGPHPGFTSRKVNTLLRHGARASFFVVGRLVGRLHEVVRELVQAGQEVVNHGYNHAYLTSLGSSEVVSQLKRTAAAIEAATGQPFTPLFRPPYGAYDPRVLTAAARAGYTHNVMWDVDPRDWRRPGVWSIVSRTLGPLAPGSIVVLHDIWEQTVHALPHILEGLSARGYRAVTVSELLEAGTPAQ